MAKTKTPFFGLAARGSVGESLTAQKRNSTTLLRAKPLPADPYSLPQAYQRWLYQDYAYLWTQQSEATRAQYRSAGAHVALTGQQYWMKVMLSTLPDIAGWWRFDLLEGGLTPDSSKNNNTGSVIGAIPITGLIAQALDFDGADDKVSCGTHPSILTDIWSIEAFVQPADKQYQALICWAADIPGAFLSWDIHPLIYMGVNYIRYFQTAARTTLVDGNPHHVVFQMPGLNQIATSEMWLDGVSIAPLTTIATGSPLAKATVTLCNRPDGTTRQLEGIADNIILRNRMLDATEIQRHSLRRYLIPTVAAPPAAIAVGPPAIDRNSTWGINTTIINLDDPADGNGTITSIEIWANTNMSGLRVGIFYHVAGNDYKCRSAVLIGNVVAGSKQTVSGLSLAIQTGDFIGYYATGGGIENSTNLHDGIMRTGGNQVVVDAQATYVLWANQAVSLHGIGTE